ncbi:MAG: acetoin utilization protein AcuC [Candidatus Thorarchaeota archaeon]
MPDKLAYPYSDELLHYEFSKTHPLKPERLKLTYLLTRMKGLLEYVEVIRPRVASRSDLELFHTSDFIEAVKKCSVGKCRNARYGLGIADNPVFPKIYEAASRYVGATLEGMKQIIKGCGRAFCISGGLHHAQRSEAAGFCIFNDVVIAIKHLLQKKDCKVLYFDFDAHHGDGVQNAFYRQKNVLTISVHQTGKTLFPGTGYVYEIGGGDGLGYSVNIPLLPGAGSSELIKVLKEVVVPLFESYEPALLVTQLGVDGHYMDPLAHLAYTTYGYEVVLNKLKELQEEYCNLGWLAVGGGGYNPINVARLWTLFLSIMLGQGITSDIPPRFKKECSNLGFDQFPTSMRDDEEVVQMYNSRDKIELDLERTLRRVREMVFPYHGLE